METVAKNERRKKKINSKQINQSEVMLYAVWSFIRSTQVIYNTWEFKKKKEKSSRNKL